MPGDEAVQACDEWREQLARSRAATSAKPCRETVAAHGVQGTALAREIASFGQHGRTVTFMQQSPDFVALRGNQASVREFALSVVTTKKGD